MRIPLLYFSLFFFFLHLTSAAQITGPATAPTGVPVGFSGPTPGISYNWSAGTGALNVDPAQFTPMATNVASAGVLPNQVKMVFDGTNWYTFAIAATSGTITRAFYGADPTSVPTVTTLTPSLTTITSNQTKCIDVIYDSTDARWYIFVTHGGQQTIYKLTMGPTGLADPSPVLEKIPMVDVNGNPVGFDVTDQLTIKKFRGEWLAFVGGAGRFMRVDLGPSPAALSPSSSVVHHVLGTNYAKYFSFYEENGEWFAFASNGVLSGINFRRIEFGPDLKNPTPAVAAVTVPGSPSTVRSVLLVAGCDNQLYGYVMGSAPTVHLLNFNGSIRNNPTAVTRSIGGLGFSADGISGVSPFVYRDTLYATMGEWKGNRLYTLRLLPLTGSQTYYYNAAHQHTFSSVGATTVNLFINQGDQSGPSAFCHSINVLPPSGPPVPGPYTIAPPSVCQNNMMTYALTGSTGAVAYHWYYTGTGVTYPVSTPTPTNILSFGSSATSGVLKVWAVDALGDSSYLSVDTSIIVNIVSNVTISPATVTICVGESVTLTADGATTYSWAPTGQTTKSITVSPTTTTTYIVTGGAAGCSDTAMRVVVVVPLPVVSVSPTTATICQGESISLTASGATSYSWSLTGATGNTITVSPTTTTTYTVTGTLSGCSATASRQVIVTPLPTVAITPSTSTICAGETVTLAATGGTTYSWSPAGGTGAVVSLQPLVSTTYTVTATSMGCSNTASSEVRVNALPNLAISPNTVAICAGDTAVLSVTGADSYVWTPTGSGGSTIQAAPQTTTRYLVEGTLSATGCKDTTSRLVIVNPLPSTQILITSGATEICEGDSVVLSATGTGYDFEWTQNGALTGTGGKYVAYTTGSYSVIATDQISGCSDSSQSVSIKIHPHPTAWLDHNDTAFCAGGVARLEVQSPDSLLTYRWQQDGSVLPLALADFLEIRESGVYNVIVGRIGIASCEDTTNEVQITVHDLPTVKIVRDGDRLSATPGFMSYQWNTPNGPIPNADDSVFTLTDWGSYSVTVLDTNGCYGSSDFIDVPYFSNGLTELSVVTEVLVYPNPSSGFVNIVTPEPVQVLVMSSDGRLLQRVAEAKTIDIQDYPTGFYLFRVIDRDGKSLRNEWIRKQ